jgi:hypothetical protein
VVRLADELLENRNDRFFMGSIYVASFNADPDVLSQWRAYASDGLGYAARELQRHAE